MVLSVIGTFAVTTSAANDLAKSYDSAVNGDLLYDVKFGQTEGAYQSAFFKGKDANPAAKMAVTVSADGKTLTMNHQEGYNAYYGGAIEGLTINATTQYTISFKVKIPTAGDNSLGIYFNFPESFANEDLSKRPEVDAILGYYGTPDTKQTLAQGGTSKREGVYLCNGQHYVTSDVAKDVKFTPDATGFYDFAFEVDGYSYTVYINNTIFDKGLFDETNKAPKLGLSFMGYHAGVFEVKDAKVFKGLTKKASATTPDYVKNPSTSNHLINASKPSDTNKLLKTYAEAANGDLLYKLKFNATEGVFAPATVYDIGAAGGGTPVLSVQATEDSMTITRIGESNSTRSVWGDTIDGLKITADTTYTLTYKIKANNAINMGIGFLTNVNAPLTATQNVYGLWQGYDPANPAAAPKVGLQTGYVAIAGEYLNSKDRLPFYPVADADGFVSLVIVIEGTKYNAYYWGACDNGTLADFTDDYNGWALLDTFDTANSANVSKDLAFLAITWNTNLNLTIKDACIYKGVAVDLDEGKPAPAETTPEETEPETEPETQAPATQAPATQAPATQAPATQAPAAEKSGCGSVIGGGLAVIAIISLGGVMIAKKRD